MRPPLNSKEEALLKFVRESGGKVTAQSNGAIMTAKALVKKGYLRHLHTETSLTKRGVYPQTFEVIK